MLRKLQGKNQSQDRNSRSDESVEGYNSGSVSGGQSVETQMQHGRVNSKTLKDMINENL